MVASGDYPDLTDQDLDIERTSQIVIDPVLQLEQHKLTTFPDVLDVSVVIVTRSREIVKR